MAKFLDGLDPEARDPADRARHGRGVRRRLQVSVLHFGEILETGNAAAIQYPKAANNRSEEMLPCGEADSECIGDLSKSSDIHTYYGDAYVLQGLSLQLEQGQILGLLGRNGVGKTTLVNSIVGFNPPRRGKIVFKGADITHSPRSTTVRSGMGLVPQGRRVFPTLERRGKPAGRRAQPRAPRLDISSASTRCSRACDERRHQRAKHAVGRRAADAGDRPRADDQPRLPDHGRAVGGLGADHHPGRLGGDRQAKEEGLSILLVEQNAALAIKLVDYVHVMSKGQVVYSAKPGSAVGQRRDQVQLSRHLTAAIEMLAHPREASMGRAGR